MRRGFPCVAVRRSSGNFYLSINTESITREWHAISATRVIPEQNVQEGKVERLEALKTSRPLSVKTAAEMKLYCDVSGHVCEEKHRMEQGQRGEDNIYIYRRRERAEDGDERNSSKTVN